MLRCLFDHFSSSPRQKDGETGRKDRERERMAAPQSVEFRGKQVPVTVARQLNDEDVQKALNSNTFKAWLTKFSQPSNSNLDLQNIEIQSIDMFGPRVGSVSPPPLAPHSHKRPREKREERETDRRRNETTAFSSSRRRLSTRRESLCPASCLCVVAPSASWSSSSARGNSSPSSPSRPVSPPQTPTATKSPPV